MAARAVYSFTGYPTGAAWRFATALRQRPETEDFATAFLASQPGAEPLAAPAQAADAEYRYRVQLPADLRNRTSVRSHGAMCVA